MITEAMETIGNTKIEEYDSRRVILLSIQKEKSSLT